MTEKENPYKIQIMRCSGLRSFPLYPEGVKELRDVLRSAGSAELAERVINRVLETMEYCPTPKDLRSIIDDLKNREQSVPSGCRECGGSGLKIVTVRRFDRIAQKEIDVDGAANCDCELGRWRARKAAERMAAV